MVCSRIKPLINFKYIASAFFAKQKPIQIIAKDFVDDVLKFAVAYGLSISPKTAPDRAYYSSLEIQMDGKFGDQIAKVSSLSNLIMSKFKLYGLSTLSFPVFGFKLNSDAATETVPIPSEFGFERRAGQPFSSSLYASWGPLRTQDHLEVLTAIEKMMTG